jgi:hypothetical protein
MQPPGYGVGRMSSQNTGVIMKKVAYRTKENEEERAEENCASLVLHSDINVPL